MTTILEAVEDFRYGIKHLAPSSQQDYLSKLRVFSEWAEKQSPPIALENLKQTVIRRFMDDLTSRISSRSKKPISTKTIHGYYRVLKVFFGFLSREEDYEEIVSEKLARKMEAPKVEQKVLETYTNDQIKSLFKAAETEYNKELVMRDKAIISVLLDCGIRAGELCSLTLDHCFLSPSDSYLRVKGKGNKTREVPLGQDATTALKRYIKKYRSSGGTDVVFLSRSGKPIGVTGLHQLMRRLCRKGNVTGVSRIVHAFRHSYACRFLAAGGDLFVLSRLLGHASVTITEEYLKAFKATDARKNGISVLDQIN